jgi:uncharacterized repeat protein (TIGR01451 family)
MSWTHTLTLLALATLPVRVFAQPPPPHGPAALLYVRFPGPPGLRVTFFGGGPGRSFEVPVTVGLRPGYIHRVEITGLADFPGVTLYPTLEVRGTLQTPPRQRAADYPASIIFNPDDIVQAQRGALVTKVIYLEAPENAFAVASHPDQPLETELRPTLDPLAEARMLGRPMVIVRLGGRRFTPDELVREAIGGTELLPGDRVLPLPQTPPYVPWACFPVFDPYLGPRPPTEECLQDGGDIGVPAGIGPDGRLGGVDPSDSVAEYRDSQGRRHVARSNRVCLCVPRYAVLRTITPPVGYETLTGPGGTQTVQERVLVKGRVPSLQALQNERLAGVRGRERPGVNVGQEGVARLLRLEVLRGVEMVIGPAVVLGTREVRQLTGEQRTRLTRQLELARQLSVPYSTQAVAGVSGPAVLGRVEGVTTIATIQETRDVTVCCNDVPQPPEKPLVLFKWADAQAAHVGDVVTFSLKYSNQGGRPITDVAVVDSLTTRLEYVPGSAKSDRDAVFTMQENEAGSLILRWEITGRLLPGQSGVVRFQARVR